MMKVTMMALCEDTIVERSVIYHFATSLDDWLRAVVFSEGFYPARDALARPLLVISAATRTTASYAHMFHTRIDL
jgi:hypothetical protein